MSPSAVDPFYRAVAQIALSVANRYGFALGGGVAWVINGLVQRPTEDVDLFTDAEGAAAEAADEVSSALRAAGFHVVEEEAATELGEIFYGFDLDQKEFLVGDGSRTVKLSLCRLDRYRSPVIMDVGPVMHIEDLVATKVAALVNRREVRDYIDVAAVMDKYSVRQLLDLAHRQDPGLEPDDIAEVGRYLDRLDDGRFGYYDLSAEDVRALRDALAPWPRA